MTKQATTPKQAQQHKYGIGSIHHTLKNGVLEVIGYVEGNNLKRRVRFIKTGFTTEASVSHIASGRVKDNLVPSICGIGYLGYCEQYDDHPLRKQIYGKWYAKISNSVKFGYSLKPEQLCFTSFMEECLKDPHWKEEWIRKQAVDILTDGSQWDCVPKSVRESREEWWANLRHMIDYLSDPDR